MIPPHSEVWEAPLQVLDLDNQGCVFTLSAWSEGGGGRGQEIGGGGESREDVCPSEG